MFGSILVFIIVLSVLVLVHEAGHFFVAKKSGIWVEEFGMGLPPRVWGKKIGDTIYSINLLPFGGFVRLHGENGGDKIAQPAKAFLNMSKKVRISVIIAGVVMNFLLAVVSFAVVYSFTGVPKNLGHVKVLEVMKNSPASESGIIVDDAILSVNGEDVKDTKGFLKLIEANKGKDSYLKISRQGFNENLIVNVKARENPPQNEGPLGVLITSTEIYYPKIWARPFLGIYYGFKDALYWGQTIILGLYSIIINLFSGQMPEGLAGPVGIFAITSEAAKIGILTLINFVGILSVNLAILNVLPFPALDGGRLLFIFIESVFGKKVMPKVEAIIHTIGMAILITLLLAITASDIKRLIVNGGIQGFLESFTK